MVITGGDGDRLMAYDRTPTLGGVGRGTLKGRS